MPHGNLIRRRDVLPLLGAGVAAYPLAAASQQAAIPIVGYLAPGNQANSRSSITAWSAGLKEVGFNEGWNLAIEYRFAEGDYGRLPALAVELVRRQPSVIMASSLPALAAIRSATSDIPIVFWIGVDPVSFGFVQSLNRPGGNLTGVTFLFDLLAEKRLQLLHDLVPDAISFALLLDPKNPNAASHIEHAKAAAQALGINLTVLTAGSADEIEPAFATAREKEVGAFLVGDDPLYDNHRAQLIAAAARYAIPTVYFRSEFAAGGGLAAYGPIFAEMARQAGVYVGRVLKGEKPADLPVMQPTKFELVINLNTAKALGLTVPPWILARADEVIE